MLIQILRVALLLSIVQTNVYIHHTEDSLTAEFYDCIHHQDLLYCRRPSEPIVLQRDNDTPYCYNNGKIYTFTLLMNNSINASFILHNWNSGIEKVEDYMNYITSESDNYVCECTNSQTFGRHCEYMLPIGTTFEETLEWELKERKEDPNKMQIYGDILCYKTLLCDSGLMCLDWRNICDGVQQCMFGYDEENCDKLEFNECEDDEYRCVNGMCIPDDYFLDGNYDCMDMTDEISYKANFDCTFQQVSMECDDRICLRNYYSCGDGQCIVDRLAFQKPSKVAETCHSYREQYYMCETHNFKKQWTLSNGRCYLGGDYREVKILNRTNPELCIYFLKCALSQGAEKNCVSLSDGKNYIEQLRNYCPSPFNQYPKGAIIGPYMYHFYNIERSWDNYRADFITINGTIKCRQYLIQNHINMSYSTYRSLRQWEELLCMSQVKYSSILRVGYDQFCYNNSETFTNQPYNVIDVCNRTKECISAYRIADGSVDCADQMDESEINRKLVLNTCIRMRRHRFRCSSEKPTCLPIHLLSDHVSDCDNNYDELLPSKLNYHSRWNSGREILRQYIENSWKVNIVTQSVEHLAFRAYCDTFWDMDLQLDEDRNICKDSWVCSKDQWQCHSGQCIARNWVLDGEWDCLDASDEQGISFTNHSLSLHNLNLISNFTIQEHYQILYDDQPFGNICDFSIEFPCFPINSSHLSNCSCISLEKVGNGHPDCLGALDERNTIEYCNHRSMLGYAFQCLSTKTCIDFYDVCIVRCPNIIDDERMCAGLTDSDNCTEANDFRCWNGTCIRNGWCNQKSDCSHGEDEYYCRISNLERETVASNYRSQKENIVSTASKYLNLPMFPYKIKTISNISIPNSTTSETVKSIDIVNKISSPIAYICNRGVGIYSYNESIACFCPEQYYGDKCQFYNDRLTVILSLDISTFKYPMNTNTTLVLKMLVLFSYENQILAIKQFHVRPAIEITSPKKQIIRFLYSRTNTSLEKKRQRYFNQSNIIHEHPYSVQIEAYELNQNENPLFISVWKYPIYFDYLPSFRLVKILRLNKTDNIYNPCSSNPCEKHYQCHQLFNQPQNYICSSSNHNSNQSYCFGNALYRRSYRSAYCICSSERYGHRCELLYDQCTRNPCENNGTCLPSVKPTEYYCMCTNLYYGKRCELSKQIVSLYINETVEHKAIIIQYFRIDVFTLKLILISQYIYKRLPNQMTDLHSEMKPPDIIVAKQYIDINQVNIYILSLQINVTSINTTTQMSEMNRCINVRMLFPKNEDKIHVYKYHHLCRKNSSLFCFYDHNFLCICDEDHYRVECFNYDHNIERCSFCYAHGQCLIENRLRKDNYFCLCPSCRSGRLCQFIDDGLSFTLHSALLRVSYVYQIIYCIMVFLMFIFGGMTNYATIITFSQSNLRKTCVGIYLLFFSIISQLTLLSLTLKSFQILLDFLINDILCKIISYVLSTSIRCSFWLISWVAMIRIFSILFPFSILLKNIRLTIIISLLTLIIIAIMDIHELFFYIKDPSGQSTCIVSYPSIVSTYERITVILHYTIPFCIQILSITGLIILAARSRSRATNNSETFVKYLQRQFQNQKEMYIVPLVIIISGLPQSILSFSFSCVNLSSWQKHLLLIAYLVAYAPQALGFLLFGISKVRVTDETVPRIFAHDASINTDMIGIFFRISIDPSVPSTPFASIREVSHYQTEEEILFSMHSIFRIGEITKMDDSNLLFQVNLQLTADSDQDLRVLTDRIRKEVDDETGWRQLGLLLLKIALSYLERGLNIFQSSLPPNHPNIGIAQKHIGELKTHFQGLLIKPSYDSSDIFKLNKKDHLHYIKQVHIRLVYLLSKDTSKYECNCPDCDEDLEKQIKELHVIQLSEPTWHIESNLPIKENVKLIIECIVDDFYPYIKHKIIHNSYDITEYGNLRILNNNKTYSQRFSWKITLIPTADWHNTIFQCFVTQGNVELNATKNLQILFAPRFLQCYNKQLINKTNDQISIECQYAGNPKPELKWFYRTNKSSLIENNNVIIKNFNENHGKYRDILIFNNETIIDDYFIVQLILNNEIKDTQTIMIIDQIKYNSSKEKIKENFLFIFILFSFLIT
ncbi:hypothetical protein I4U23_011306 [Adineta vaga]|nr:hypothetical protein I4U23_011306 [Adineta vaga]